jgi:hypothetical protein
MAPKEIIDFPYLGNHMNSPTANFEMAEMGSLGVHLGNFLLVCRDFMAVGYDAFLRMNTFAFTCVGAFGQFDRFLSQGKIAEYRGKVRKLRFFMFAKTSDPVPIISTHMGSLRKFKWLTHVHFDFAALEIGCWMLSTDEKKQEWLTMLTHFSKHVTTSSKALIHVTGFPSGEMKDAFLTTLMTMMKSDQDHIVPDNGCLNYEKKGRPSKWIVSRILDVK